MSVRRKRARLPRMRELMRKLALLPGTRRSVESVISLSPGPRSFAPRVR